VFVIGFCQPGVMDIQFSGGEPGAQDFLLQEFLTQKEGYFLADVIINYINRRL
jgi:hypothetical protein